jgi:hypothetical protein
LRLQCGMPCSKLEVSTVQHGTLSGAGYLHQSLALDPLHSVWPIASADGIICINMSTFRLGRRH